MDHTFSDDVYQIESLLPVSPAAEAALTQIMKAFYDQVTPIASMYGVTLSYMAPASSSYMNEKSVEKPTHKWAVKIYQNGKKPGILGFDTACSYADAMSNLGRIASQYPVDW